MMRMFRARARHQQTSPLLRACAFPRSVAAMQRALNTSRRRARLREVHAHDLVADDVGRSTWQPTPQYGQDGANRPVRGDLLGREFARAGITSRSRPSGTPRTHSPHHVHPALSGSPSARPMISCARPAGPRRARRRPDVLRTARTTRAPGCRYSCRAGSSGRRAARRRGGQNEVPLA